MVISIQGVNTFLAYQVLVRIKSHFLLSLSTKIYPFTSQKLTTLFKLQPTWISAKVDHFSLGMISFLSLFMHFIHLDLGFWVFENSLWFLKIDEFFFENFWVGFCLNDPICLCIASQLHFHYVSCI